MFHRFRDINEKKKPAPKKKPDVNIYIKMGLWMGDPVALREEQLRQNEIRLARICAEDRAAAGIVEEGATTEEAITEEELAEEVIADEILPDQVQIDETITVDVTLNKTTETTIYTTDPINIAEADVIQPEPNETASSLKIISTENIQAKQSGGLTDLNLAAAKTIAFWADAKTVVPSFTFTLSPDIDRISVLHYALKAMVVRCRGAPLTLEG